MFYQPNTKSRKGSDTRSIASRVRPALSALVFATLGGIVGMTLSNPTTTPPADPAPNSAPVASASTPAQASEETATAAAETTRAAPQEGSAQEQEQAQAPDDSSCAKRTWPYLDQRCADSAKDPGQATREVRVVSTDRGASPTIVTAVPPPVEAKREPAKPEPAKIAAKPQTAVLGTPQAQTEPSSVPQQKLAPENPRPDFAAKAATVAETTASITPPPSAATQAPAQASSPAAKPEASAPQPVPPEATKPARKVTAAKFSEGKTKQAQGRVQNGKTVPAVVPADVIAAVKAAADEERQSNGRRVTVSRKSAQDNADDGEVIAVTSPGRGQRIFVVPRESDAEAW